ncbi:unnamed protein product [Polarella glacialis]|uniref:Uncharacterized protein n=1 Tax=Polarella glacialis TaxID=89957 RepID=A0A813JIL1_POLGL|nr:unnamed protein product [Polarella glacialis]CAE8676205.1 unnamed protein product [Polarella glacialis]
MGALSCRPHQELEQGDAEQLSNAHATKEGYSALQIRTYTGTEVHELDVESEAGPSNNFAFGRHCFIIFIFLSIGCFAAAAAFVLGGKSKESAPSATRREESSSASLFDCKVVPADWEAVWPVEKMAYCCKNFSVGCVTFHCDVDSDDWGEDWSQLKKDWCCRVKQVGCMPATAGATPVEDACHSSCKAEGVTATCRDRISFAAKHAFAGQEHACGQAYSQVQVECGSACQACSIDAAQCQALPVVKYNCVKGYDNWQQAWPQAKQRWCCSHQSKACAASQTQTSEPFDCTKDYEHWTTTWPVEKKLWCCQHAGTECPF